MCPLAWPKSPAGLDVFLFQPGAIVYESGPFLKLSGPLAEAAAQELSALKGNTLSMIIRSVIFGVIAGLVLVTAGFAQENRRLLDSKESLYNNIYVYEDPPYRSMTFGHNKRIYTESTYNTGDDRDLPVEYTRYMTATLMYAKDVHAVLEIGFGGGRTAWYLHRFLPKVAVTSVELDPTVVELARKYFGVRDEPNF